jgi:hypothetical protein
MCIVSLLDFLRNEPIITDRKPSQEGKSVTISLVATAQNTLLWQFVYSQSLRISEPLRNSRIGSISNQMCSPSRERERISSFLLLLCPLVISLSAFSGRAALASSSKVMCVTVSMDANFFKFQLRT